MNDQTTRTIPAEISQGDHERWLRETWQMIQHCTASDTRGHGILLTQDGCAALLDQKRRIAPTRQLLDRAIQVMTDFHAEFEPDDSPELRPVTSPAAFKEFVDLHARLMFERGELDRTARIGPTDPNNDMVICPTCTSQFVAIPVNVQERLQRLNALNDNPAHYDTEVDQLTTRPWRGSPNDAVRWVCPKCRTVNANADERCCVSSCEGRRPDPWPPVTRPGRMPPWAVLLLECRDALPAISLATAKLRGLDLTLADRIEKMLEPWKVPEGKPAKYPPPSSPPAPGPDLACEGFVPDPHSQFCDRCGYPEREHRKPAAGV